MFWLVDSDVAEFGGGVGEDGCKVDAVANGEVAVSSDDGGDVSDGCEDGEDECNVGGVGRTFEGGEVGVVISGGY